MSRIILFLLVFLAFVSGIGVKVESPSDNGWIKGIIQRLEVSDYYWALDGDGNLCITGYFMNTARFDKEKLVSVGNFDIFLAKYSKTGDLLWLRQAGGSDPDIVKLIKTDNNNNIYITGYFTGVSFFDSYVAHARGRSDIFTAKYDSSGELLWLKSEGAEIICEPNPVKRKIIARKFKK